MLLAEYPHHFDCFGVILGFLFRFLKLTRMRVTPAIGFADSQGFMQHFVIENIFHQEQLGITAVKAAADGDCVGFGMEVPQPPF